MSEGVRFPAAKRSDRLGFLRFFSVQFVANPVARRDGGVAISGH
jgi:hypothetical protein